MTIPQTGHRKRLIRTDTFKDSKNLETKPCPHIFFEHFSHWQSGHLKSGVNFDISKAVLVKKTIMKVIL